MNELNSTHPYFNTPEEESGAPAEGQEDFRAGGVVSLGEHISRLRQTGDKVLINRVDELEKGLAVGKVYSEIGALDAEKIKELWQNLPKLDVLAYGGTSYSERVRVGRWSMESGLMGSRESLEGEKVSYGVGKKADGYFIILRTLLNTKSRGGYPYTVLFDFGDEVWKSVQYNYALIIQKILENKELIDKILNNPEALNKSDFKALATAEWKIGSQKSQKLDSLVAISAERPKAIFGNQRTSWPEPAAVATALDRLKPQKRQEFTWLIGGGGDWQNAVKINMVYNPDYGDSQPESLKD